MSIGDAMPTAPVIHLSAKDREEIDRWLELVNGAAAASGVLVEPDRVGLPPKVT